MAIQIVKHAGGFVHAIPSGLLVPNLATLFKSASEVLALLGPENLDNIFYTLAHHTGVSAQAVPALPVRTHASFEYQTALAWDLDKTDQNRPFEYLAIVARVLQTPPETLRFLTSGHGYHVIANLRKPIRDVKYFKENKAAYNEVCLKMSGEIKAAGLPLGKMDTVIFEGARVLRMPGTWNSKPGLPRVQCRELQATDAQLDIDLKELSGLAELEKLSVSPEQIRRLYPTPDLSEVVKECRFVASCLENPELMHEPQMFDLAGILAQMPVTAKAAFQGREQTAYDLAQYAFTHASGSPSLARQTFEEKWLQGQRYGTRKCSTIASRWSVECKTCPHRDRIPTPLALKSKAHIESESTGYWVINSKGNYVYPHYGDLAKVYSQEHRYVHTLEGRFFVYEAPIYQPIRPSVVKAWLESRVNPTDPLRESHRFEFLKKIEATGVLTDAEEDKMFGRGLDGKLNCQNGILDILTGQLTPHSDKYGFQYCLPYDYAPESEPEEFLDWLALITEDRVELMECLLDVMAYAIWPNYDDHVFAYFIGDGGNGKSTLIHVMAALVGKQNFSAISIEQLTTNRFAPAQLEGKLVNLSEESSGYELSVSACNMIKQMSDGGTVLVEKKGEQGYNMQNRAKLIFSANQVPKFKDESGALKRRLLVIPFDYQIQVKDPRVEARLIAEVPAILGLLVRRIQANYAANGRFVVNRGGEAAARAQKKVLDAGNTAIEFGKSRLDFSVKYAETDYVSAKDVYTRYLAWCEETGHRFHMNQNTFSRYMVTDIVYAPSEVIRISGVPTRVYKRTRWKEVEQ